MNNKSVKTTFSHPTWFLPALEDYSERENLSYPTETIRHLVYKALKGYPTDSARQLCELFEGDMRKKKINDQYSTAKRNGD